MRHDARQFGVPEGWVDAALRSLRFTDSGGLMLAAVIAGFVIGHFILGPGTAVHFALGVLMGNRTAAIFTKETP